MSTDCGQLHAGRAIPETNGRISVLGTDLSPAVRQERQQVECPGLGGLEPSAFPAGSAVQEANALVVRAHGNSSAVRRKGEASYTGLRNLELADQFAGGHIPQA